MKNIIHKLSRINFIAVAVLLLFNACVDHDFEKPEPLEIPLGEVHTIADLRQLYQDLGPDPIRVNENLSVTGVITMDGSSGNIYRTAFLQDHTAAISLRILSPGGLYEGDSVRINLNGTRINAHENMLQIDSLHVGNHITKLATQVHVEPELTDINTLLSNPAYQAKLIRLEGVEFNQSELGETYANKEELLSENRILRDCEGNEIIVRTSGYASFADDTIPEGNGSIVAILAQFRDEKQLFIRDIDEVQLQGDRCPIPGEDMEPITIADIRELESQGIFTVPANRRLEGVVISDQVHENHPGQNLFLMDENGDGIALRFASFHEFELGSNLRVMLGNLPIERFEGLLQINNIPLGNGYVLGDAPVPDPQTTTMLNMVENFESFESTLVYIENVVIPPGNSWAGNINVTDGTASVIMRTYDWASFAQTPVTGGIYNVVAIASYYNGVQLQLRSLEDLEYVGEYDPGEADLITLAELRSLFNDGANTVPEGKSIEVVITSDNDNGNVASSNAFAQDDSGGMALRFSSGHNLNLGDKVRIFVGNAELSTYRGLLQINNIPTGNAELLETGIFPEPEVTTISNILENMDTMEGKLVTIENATISGGTTYNGEKTVTDSTGSIAMYTRSQASFSGEQIPSEAVSITAIVSVFDDPQIVIRNLNDIE
ncbi:MAG: DUF5689 domain-containing protein [Bacteroidota bacterium]